MHPMDIVLEALSLLALVSTWWKVRSCYWRLPERVPTHFGLTGAPDQWSRRSAIWLLPGVSLFVYALFTGILCTMLNSHPVPPHSLRLPLEVLKLEMLVMFWVIVRDQVKVALGQAARLGGAFWICLLAVLATGAAMPAIGGLTHSK